MWRRQLEELAEDFRLVAWDAPGAGESSDPPDAFTITDWADCLSGSLDAVGVREANLEHLGSLIPGVELAFIPEAGHVSKAEQPERFSAQLRRFCQGAQVD